jgi:hypothetical protein
MVFSAINSQIEQVIPKALTQFNFEKNDQNEQAILTILTQDNSKKIQGIITKIKCQRL